MANGIKTMVATIAMLEKIAHLPPEHPVILDLTRKFAKMLDKQPTENLRLIAIADAPILSKMAKHRYDARMKQIDREYAILFGN